VCEEDEKGIEIGRKVKNSHTTGYDGIAMNYRDGKEEGRFRLGILAKKEQQR
jgi:hypothetical protein